MIWAPHAMTIMSSHGHLHCIAALALRRGALTSGKGDGRHGEVAKWGVRLSHDS